MNNREEMFCPVINQRISEIECYETLMGFADTLVKRKSLMSSDQIRIICNKCQYSNVD